MYKALLQVYNLFITLILLDLKFVMKLTLLLYENV